MHYIQTLLCLLLPLAALAQTPEENRRRVENSLMPWVSFEGKEPLRFTLEERLQALDIPGITIAVIKDYKVEWAKGYGWADKEEKRPVTTETLFQAASISKSLNGVAIMKLVQDGKLKLDEDINVYLKTWHPDSSKGTITLAHLLSHTAGLTIHGFPGYWTTDTLPSTEDILQGRKPANTNKVKPFAAPGEKFQYSGGGTTVSQLVLTTVTGQRYEQFLQREVLDPLGMTQSFFHQPPPPNKAHLLATAYENDGTPVKGKYHIYPEQGAAGLWTNPTDLARYIIETQLSKEGKSAKVLTQAMTEKRLTPYLNKNSGLGVFRMWDGRWFGHNGGNWGFACTYAGSMEGGNGFVIMTNVSNHLIIDEIARAIGEVYQWKDYQQSEKFPLLPPPADSLKQRYAGTYVGGNENKTTIEVLPSGNDLVMKVNNGRAFKTYFTGPAKYVITEQPAMWTLAGDTLKMFNGQREAVFLKRR